MGPHGITMPDNGKNKAHQRQPARQQHGLLAFCNG